MHRIPKSPASTRRILPNLDLTPLADVAWLLLVFFIVTTKLRVLDKHPVDLPTSTYDGCQFGAGMDFKVRIQANGHMWIWLPYDLRTQMIQQGIPPQANPATIAFWNQLAAELDIGFGLNAPLQAADAINQVQKEGVTQAQDIAEWSRWVKSVRPNARFSIQADRNTPYPILEKVFSAFQRVHVNRFSLITRLEMEEEEG